MRSCTHSKGFSRSAWASRKPAQPASRGEPRTAPTRWGWVAPARASAHPAAAGGARTQIGAGPERTGLPPPATRERPTATRLATFMFYFCSFSRESGDESQCRDSTGSESGGARDLRGFGEPGHDHRLQRRRATLGLGQECADLVHDLAEDRPMDREAACDRCRSPPPCRAHGRGPARRSARRSRPAATTGQASAPAACRANAGTAAR